MKLGTIRPQVWTVILAKPTEELDRIFGKTAQVHESGAIEILMWDGGTIIVPHGRWATAVLQSWELAVAEVPALADVEAA